MWAAIFFLKDQDFQIEMEHARYSLYSLTTADKRRVFWEEEENEVKKWNKNYRFDYFQGTTRRRSSSRSQLCKFNKSEIEAINFKKGFRMVSLLSG